MKGARAEPWANTSSAPSTSMNTMIGINQSFFRTRRNNHSSLVKLV